MSHYRLVSCHRSAAVFLLLVVGPLVAGGGVFGQTYDYQAEYESLSAEIQKHRDKPQPAPDNDARPYGKEMARKAKQRDRAVLLHSAALADGSPLAGEFRTLTDRAQTLGDSVAAKGALHLLKFSTTTKEAGHFALVSGNWKEVIGRLKNYGRPLRLGAEQHGFSLILIIDRALCMIRYSVSDIEIGHTGLYDGRALLIGKFDDQGVLVIPDRDFDEDCAQRIEFVQQEKGCPIYPTEIGLNEAKLVRVEAEWWGFFHSKQEMTQLMEEFFRDTLCLHPMPCGYQKVPSGKGLRTYENLAREHQLPKAEELVRGFYGSLYGKVELLTGDGKKPAVGAKVLNRSPKDDEEWRTIADDQGWYKLSRVPLHKYCGPYEVKAEHEQGADYREYEGPLEEPELDYRHREDLEIISAQGQLEFWEHFEYQVLGTCTVEEPVDTVSFQLTPTWDPCVFDIVGGTSVEGVYKLFCHSVSGGECPRHDKRWMEQERQTRIVGGTVNFRDTTKLPFRPKVQHIRSYTRCDATFSTCITPERPHGIGCGPKAPQTTGWIEDPNRQMALKNGVVDDSTSGDGEGTFYRLLIDEKPFRALEKRCQNSRKAGESGPGRASLD